MVQIYSGITGGRVVNGELDAQRLQVVGCPLEISGEINLGMLSKEIRNWRKKLFSLIIEKKTMLLPRSA